MAAHQPVVDWTVVYSLLIQVYVCNYSRHGTCNGESSKAHTTADCHSYRPSEAYVENVFGQIKQVNIRPIVSLLLT